MKMMILLVFSYLVVALSAQDAKHFYVMGDWGGQGSDPYYTKDEKSSADAMNKAAGNAPALLAIGLGDNFYPAGIKNENDPRFKETFEDVFTQNSKNTALAKVPFYFCAGNHDHYGNAQAEVTYATKNSGKTMWKMPALWYTFSINEPGYPTVDFVLVDTVGLSGNVWDSCDGNHTMYAGTDYTPPADCATTPQGPSNQTAADDQWAWIERTLSASTADYLIVGGHYPVWSIAEHGPTAILVKKLKPLFEKYKVSAYMCGHDHTFEYIQPSGQDVQYHVIGGTHTCDSSKAHADKIPKGSLKYHGCTEGGFARFDLTKSGLTASYFNGDGEKSTFTSPPMSRHK